MRTDIIFFFNCDLEYLLLVVAGGLALLQRDEPVPVPPAAPVAELLALPRRGVVAPAREVSAARPRVPRLPAHLGLGAVLVARPAGLLAVCPGQEPV